VLDMITRRVGTREMRSMGGIAKVAPTLAIFFLVIVMGAVGLPLTNGFVGEFLLWIGVYHYGIWYAVFGGLTLILGAVYMLRMYQKVMLGDVNPQTSVFSDVKGTEWLVLAVIVLLVIGIGVYPKPLLHISEAAVTEL